MSALLFRRAPSAARGTDCHLHDVAQATKSYFGPRGARVAKQYGFSGFGGTAGDIRSRMKDTFGQELNNMENGRSARVERGAVEPTQSYAENPRLSTKLREATWGDYEQIEALELRHGLGITTGSLERWRHIWLNNPEYRHLQQRWPIGWVIEDEKGQIVASIGNIPLPYELAGKRVLVVSGRSWVAEVPYRGKALSLLDRVINQPNVDLYLNNTANSRSENALEVFNCSRVPVGLWDESVFWITHHQAFVERLLARKTGKLAKPLSYPFSAVAYLKDRVSAKGLRASDVEVKSLTAFDDRFDDFWMDLKRMNPHLLLAVRTREILEWHFKYALLDNRLWIATVIDNSRLAAYAIFEQRDSRAFGLTRMRLVDFQSLDGTTALLEPLLCWALRKCRTEGVHMLEIVGCWLEKGAFIETVAPYRRKLESWRFLYRANNPSLATTLQDPRTWAPFLFDGDAAL